MRCPSKKQIYHFLFSGLTKATRIQAHVQECPVCRARVEEEHELNTFIRNNFKHEIPSPFLWTRIEAQLDKADHLAPAIYWWQSLPKSILSAAAAFLLLALVTVGVLIQERGPSQQDILASIDIQYEQTLQSLNALDNNPFNGKKIYLATNNTNPFQTVISYNNDLTVNENPFESKITEKKAFRR